MSFFSEQEALLANSGKEIYIDEGLYTDEKVNRWRFTLAHEAGHIFLHDHVFSKINTLEEFEKLYTECHLTESWEWMERQANWFAAHLLMPSESLKTNMKDFQAEITKITNEDVNLKNPEVAAGRLKYPAMKFYGISAHFAEIRISNFLTKGF